MRPFFFKIGCTCISKSKRFSAKMTLNMDSGFKAKVIHSCPIQIKVQDMTIYVSYFMLYIIYLSLISCCVINAVKYPNIHCTSSIHIYSVCAKESHELESTHCNAMTYPADLSHIDRYALEYFCSFLLSLT